jgi:hypothetical protein
LSRDIPIIFSAAMVKAHLEDRKGMTRRLAKRMVRTYPNGRKCPPVVLVERDSPWTKVKVGDRLWVREGWKPHSLYAGMRPSEMPKTNVFYLADKKYEPSNVAGIPSIHMPRWASRLTLIVTSTKIEPVQSISHDDAMAEGVQANIIPHQFGVIGPNGGWLGSTFATAPAAFSYLWMSLHGIESWEANPSVVALSYRVIKSNIDAPEARTA